MSVDYIDSVKKIVGEYTFKYGVEFDYESYRSVRVIYVYFEKAPYHAFAVRVDDENGDVEINTPGSMANGEAFAPLVLPQGFSCVYSHICLV